MLWLFPVVAGAAWIYKINQKPAPTGVRGELPGPWTDDADRGARAMALANPALLEAGDYGDDMGGKDDYYYFAKGREAFLTGVRTNPYKKGSWQAQAWIEGYWEASKPAFGSVSASDGDEDWYTARTRPGWPNEMNEFGAFGGGNDVVDPTIIIGLNDDEREMWVMNDEGLYGWMGQWKRDQRMRGRTASTRAFLRENRDEIDAIINRSLGRGFGAWAADTDDDSDTESAFGNAVRRMSAKELRMHRDNLVRKYRRLLRNRVQATAALEQARSRHRQIARKHGLSTKYVETHSAKGQSILRARASNEKRLAATWVQIAEVQRELGNKSHPFVPSPLVPKVATILGAW
jgi:hypothetical protein